MAEHGQTSDLTSDFVDESRKLLGERIRLLWKESGQPQDEFVKGLGITTVTLSNYMNGKRKPDSELLLAVKRKTNICIDWLLTGVGPMRPGEQPQTATNAPEPPVNTVETAGCARCAEMKAELEEERRERRELSAELREVNAENRRLGRENGELRAKCAELKERQKHCCPEPLFPKKQGDSSGSAQACA